MNLSELALLANIVMPLVTLLVGAGQIAVVWWGITQMIKSNEDRAAGAKEASRQADQRHQETMDLANQRHQETMDLANQRHQETMDLANQRHQETMANHKETMERMEKQHNEAMAKHEATMEQLRQQGVALKTLIERNR